MSTRVGKSTRPTRPTHPLIPTLHWDLLAHQKLGPEMDETEGFQLRLEFEDGLDGLSGLIF